MGNGGQNLDKFEERARTLEARVEHLEKMYVMKMGEIRECSLRVRRDILAHELYFLRLQEPPHWGRFLAYLKSVDSEFTLKEDMPAEVSARMVIFLNQEIETLKEERGGNDPGDAPLPPFL